MIDRIEDRLRQTADALDVAVERYQADDGYVTPLTNSRPRRVALVAVVTLAIVIAGVGVLVSRARHASTGHAIDSTTPDSGEGTPGPVGWSATRTSGDGRQLLIMFTGGAPYDPTNPCTVDYTVTVAETDQTVKVRIVGHSPPIPSSTSEVDAVCDDRGYLRQVTAQLRTPLAGRRVIDATSGAEQAVLDGASLADVGWIPDGWVLKGEGVAFPTVHPSLVWSRGWGPDQPAGPNAACTSAVGLIEGPADLVAQIPWALGDEVLGTYDVHGVIATLSTSTTPLSQRLAWALNGRGFTLVSATCQGEALTAVDVLLHIARSLTPHG